MKRVLFIDATCTQPYDAESLRMQGLGGTEATVVRVATALARWFSVSVAQACREGRRTLQGVGYVPYDFKHPSSDVLEADAIVVVRADKILPRLRRQVPRASLFLWLHCFPGRKRKFMPHVCRDNDVTLVAVSGYHRLRLRRFAEERCPDAAHDLRIEVVYNPIDDALRPRPEVAVDPDRLLFTSSPHKGLDQVFEHFAHARRYLPSLRLLVANPGYLHWKVRGGSQEGIEVLGSLPHPRVIEHMRSSFCLFYPQHTFEETFGLVLAEANAVGTPALAHPLGAAPEVLSGAPEQLVDATDHDAVLERLLHWRRHGRPQVALAKKFRLPEIAARWAELLEGTEVVALGA